MSKKINDLVQKRTDLEAELVAINTQLAEEESRAEEWVSAEEARSILARWRDPKESSVPFSRYLPVVKTLVTLRPEPDNESDVYLTWATPKDEDSMFQADQFSVSLDLIHEEILLNDDYEQVAHTLSTEEAELLGRRLLGAAEASRKPLGE